MGYPRGNRNEATPIAGTMLDRSSLESPALFDTTVRGPRARQPESLGDCRPEGWRDQPEVVQILPPEREAQVLGLLEAPLRPGEPASQGFARKEHELRELFKAMPAIECSVLQKRLRVADQRDRLVIAFGLLVGDRRNRLVAVLADARRREALRGRR